MMLEDIVSAGGEKKARAKHLLETLVKIKAHSSLESAMSRLDQSARAGIFELVRSMDKELAENIEQKITHRKEI